MNGKILKTALITALAATGGMASQFYTNVITMAKADGVDYVAGFKDENSTKTKKIKRKVELQKTLESFGKQILKEKVKAEENRMSDNLPGLQKINVIYFKKNDSCIYKEKYQDILKEMTENMKKKGTPVIFVIGTASPEGNFDYNNELARKRALAAKEKLIQLGYPKNKIKIAYKTYKNRYKPADWPSLRKVIFYTAKQ